MKAVILAGGLGTRLSEETQLKPKPMVEIGGKPILWHIMKIYSSFGVNDFIVCLGYKGYIVKEYFSNYLLHTSDVTWDFKQSRVEFHQQQAEPWRVTLVDTGHETMTGGRLKRIAPFLDDETFLLTYGDGVADINVAESIKYHREHGKAATLTAAQPPGRFGHLAIEDDGRVSVFQEKPQGEGGWINGGFFVLEPSVIDHIEGDASIWEREPLEQLSADSQLAAYKHYGFWLPMDTLRDKQQLEQIWASGKAPWKMWSDEITTNGEKTSVAADLLLTFDRSKAA